MMRIFSFFVAYLRLRRFKRIRAEKNERIKEAIKYLKKYEKLPISKIYVQTCKILKINSNEEGRKFVIQLSLKCNYKEEVEKLSRKLP